MDTDVSLLGVPCAHSPASEYFVANGSSLPPSEGTPRTREPLCQAESRDSYSQVLHPQLHNQSQGLMGMGGSLLRGEPIAGV